ncbi:MAG: dihydrodipicolinate reductase [Desulfobacterales bacterium]
MNPIKVMMNGIPGNVVVTITRHLLGDDRFRLIPYALTGPEITGETMDIDGHRIELIRPDHRQAAIDSIKAEEGTFISADFTHPSAVNSNANFYCQNHLPFVMGTTGGDRQQLHAAVAASDVSAVIAPNMAKQIVGFQAIMEYGAQTFPDLFKGYSLKIRESHQEGKADTSGTAKAMIAYFNAMGIPFTEAMIEQERDPAVQKDQWHIPEAYLPGHAWHTYTLASEDETVSFEFTHNINGRDIYAQGALDGIAFLHKKLEDNVTGKIFTMIDVLKGA